MLRPKLHKAVDGLGLKRGARSSRKGFKLACFHIGRGRRCRSGRPFPGADADLGNLSRTNP